MGSVCAARISSLRQRDLAASGEEYRRQQHALRRRHLRRRYSLAHVSPADQEHRFKYVRRLVSLFCDFAFFVSASPQSLTTMRRLHFSLLSRLYRLTGEKAYFDEAVEVLNWWLGWAFEPLTGQIHDSIIGPTCYVEGLQSFTYNSGTILFGLADLYYATGNTTLLDLGRSIAYAAMRDYTIAETGVLREKCELDPAPADNLPPGCTQDEITVRPTFARRLAALTRGDTSSRGSSRSPWPSSTLLARTKTSTTSSICNSSPSWGRTSTTPSSLDSGGTR